MRSETAAASGPAGIVSELVLIGLVLVAAGLLFAQALSIPADYDEGSYLAAVDALRHGQSLGKDVFAPQPPAFYTVLVAGDAVLGHSLKAIRSEVLALALLGCVGAYLIGRLVAGRAAGLAAAAVLAVAGPYPDFAGRISADLPGLAVGLFALAAFLAACKRPRGHSGDALALAAGALLAFAVLVKASAVTLLVPLGGYALMRFPGFRRLALAVVGAAAVVVAFVIAYRSGLHGIWRGAVSYHSAARGAGGPGTLDNLRHYEHFFDPRTRNALVWVYPLGLLAWLSLPPSRRRLPLLPLWSWPVVAFGFNVWHRPLHDNHDVLIAVSLALPAGTAVGAALTYLRTRQALAGAALVLAVLTMGYVKELHGLLDAQGPEQAQVRWAVAQLRTRTKPDELVATDRPIIAVLADRRMPGDLVDTAALRFHSGYLTPGEVLADIDRSHVRVVVAARSFRFEPVLIAGLERRFRNRVRFRDVTLYVKPGPRAASSG